MATYTLRYATNLAADPLAVPIPAQLARGDSDAYVFEAQVYDSRDPQESVLAGTVSCSVVRPDGGTVTFLGEKDETTTEIVTPQGTFDATVCRATLPQAALAYPGRVNIAIRLIDGAEETTVLNVSAVVVRTATDTAIDPGEVVPNLEELLAKIGDCEAATEAANDAAEAASTAMNGAVRFDEPQTLTNPEQRQARTNISATHTGVVDAWYARNGQHPATAKESITTTVESVDFVANGLCVTANGTASSGIVVSLLGWRAMVAGGVTTPNADQLAEGGANGFDVVQGHLYRLRLTLISGTRTGGAAAFIALYDTTGAVITGTGCDENKEKYITMDRSNIGQVCMFLKKNTVFTNAVYTMEFEDLTASGVEAKHAAEVQRINALNRLVDYGYTVPFDGALGNLNVRRRDTIVQISGGSTSGSTTPSRLCLTGEPVLATGSSAISATSGVKLESGHRYRITRTYISGTATNNVYPFPTYVGFYSRLAGDVIYSGNVAYYDFTFTPMMDENDNVVTDEVLVALGITRRDTGNVFTNYVCSVTLEDITYGVAEDGNIAPVDTPTATSTHTTGSLLMMGRQLYKATADIESGNTITPGTNVTETSVAAELAARDTAITALQNPPGYVHMSDLSAYGTDGVFTPDGDSDLEITLTVPYNGDTRNQIYTCIAKYERAGGVTVWPTIVFRYGNTLNRTTSYTIGGNGCFETKQWRVIRYPGVTTTLTIVITIPVGVTVTIRDFYNEYSDAVSRTPHGIRINGHRQYLPNTMNPDTIPGVMMAIKCGTCSMIQIPKRLSDGTWIFYHDDSLVYNDTYIRQADGTELPSTYNGTLWSNITPEEAYSWDWGITRGALFAGTKPMTMEQFFTICGKTGIMPMLSMHPWPTDAELGEIKAIASKCGVLNRLGIKCTVARIGTAYSIFGNDIESYTIDVSSGTQAQSVVEAAITAMNGLTGCTVRRVIELFASTAYNAYFGTTQYDAFKLIADAGYGCALASQTGAYHPTLPNYTSVVMKASDFEFWQGKGVSEYTYEYGWSNGLNW